jgi:hypothetical protein
MKKNNTLIKSRPETVIGIDLGDKRSHICVLNEGGACVETGTVVTTPSGFEGRFKRIDPCRIAIEAGGQSAWVDELLTKLGHEVVVANPRRLRMIYENDSKSDEVDAEQLARVARLVPLHDVLMSAKMSPAPGETTAVWTASSYWKFSRRCAEETSPSGCRSLRPA